MMLLLIGVIFHSWHPKDTGAGGATYFYKDSKSAFWEGKGKEASSSVQKSRMLFLGPSFSACFSSVQIHYPNTEKFQVKAPQQQKETKAVTRLHCQD